MKIFTFILLLIVSQHTFCQQENSNSLKNNLNLLERDTTFNAKRFYSGLGFTTIAYAGTLYGLSEAWYDEKTRSDFHFYNDWGEWEHMDKAGHVYTSYLYSRWVYHGSRWAGVNKSKSLILSGISSTVFQLTVEIFDAHSADWGFSIPDIAANTAGTLSFLVQEMIWDEQRILLKFSAYPRRIEDVKIRSIPSGGEPMLLKEIIEKKYGNSLASQLLKNYNNQTYWLSINPKSFLPNLNFPRWINIALGYGVKDIYGGYTNLYRTEDYDYSIDLSRKRYYYLSLDIDWERIKWKSPFMKSFSILLNSIKTPAPAISINSFGQLEVHLIFF